MPTRLSAPPRRPDTPPRANRAATHATTVLATLAATLAAGAGRAQAQADPGPPAAAAVTTRAAGGGVGVPAALVPLADPATGLVEQLLALVPVAGGTVGQRPYATREVVRVALAARRELTRRANAPGPAGAGDARAAAIAQALLDAYAPALAPDAHAPPRPSALTVRALDFVWAHAVGSGEAPVAFVPDNGLGRIAARTLPALDARSGRPAVRGVVTSVETAHAAGVGGWLAVVAQPRASLVARYDDGFRTGARWNVEPQRLYARAVARNVALQAGIDEWAWGQGGAGGAFLSANARPLRALSLQSDTAFALPGRLARLGRWRASLLAADLGRAQNYPHAKLLAYKVSLAARPTVELGAGVMSQVGGRGAPPMSTADRAADLFPFVGWLREGSDLLRSNKLASVDARVRVPGWRGLSVAYELTVDDFDLRRPRSVLWEDSGNLLAVSLPRLAADGAFALDLRAQRTGVRQYRHYQFVSGVTYRDQVLGAPLGPNAGAVSAALTWRPTPFDAVAVTVAGEARDPSVYANTNPDPNGTLIFRKVQAGTVERRLRAVAGWERGGPGRGVSTTARLGVERVGGYGYVPRLAITRPFGEGGVRVRF